MALEHDIDAIEAKWRMWETGCNGSVADELAEIELAKVRAENSRGGIPLATAEALTKYEAGWRAQYDADRAAEASALDIETTILAERINEAIAAGADVRSEREVHGTGTANGLTAGVLEELVLQRVSRELASLTLRDIKDLYASADDVRDRTLVRFVEQAVASGKLSRLGAEPDPSTDAGAALELQAAVAARRRARVAPSLMLLRERLTAVRSMTRHQIRGHLAAGRGIARRP